MSSDDTPSPTQDIFPEINPSKKSSPEITKSTEITSSKSETFHLNCDMPGKQCSGLRTRATPIPKKNFKELETSAKTIAEKLSGDIETIDKIIHEKGLKSTSPRNRVRLNSLYNEVKTSASKLETDLNNQMIKNKGNIESVNIENEEATKTKILDVRRNVPKRKLDEEISKTPEKSPGPAQDLSESQQQKLISMTKTWNDIKDKIQEERMKAEEKMKELCKMNSERDVEDHDDGSSSESESNKEFIQQTVDKVDVKIKKELETKKAFLEKEIVVLEDKTDIRFTNLTNDDFILTELEKTDKMFKKLRNGNRKPLQKSSSLGKRSKSPVLTKKSNSLDLQQLENVNYRTTSRMEQKTVENFQNEHQKQHLLKALKAIDVGKDPNYSTDETDQSESENEKSFSSANNLKRVQRISSSAGKTQNNIMKDVFGTNPGRFDKNNGLKIEYGTVGGSSAREE